MLLKYLITKINTLACEARNSLTYVAMLETAQGMRP